MGACFWVWMGFWFVFWVFVLWLYITKGIPWEREMKEGQEKGN
jgi:hypothetical protein